MNLMLCHVVFDVMFDEVDGLFLMFCLMNLMFLTLCRMCVHLLVMFDEFAVLFWMNLMFYV